MDDCLFQGEREGKIERGKKERKERRKERRKKEGRKEGKGRREGERRASISILGQYLPIKYISRYLLSLVKEDIIPRINIDKG